MAIQLQLRRGTETENDIFMGASGEVSVDTTLNTLRVHDGVTIGGHELAKASLSNALITKSLTPSISGEIDVGSTSNKWRDIYLTRSIKLGTSSILPVADGLSITGSFGEIGINQSLKNTDSPTFQNLTINGTIYGLDLQTDFTVVANNAERNSLSEKNAGMLVLTKDSNRLWQLKSDNTTWQDYIPRPLKQTIEYDISSIASLQFVDFDLNIGNSLIAYKVEVSHPCMFEVFDTPERDQENPYKFIATEDHLIDDGSSLLSDGTILRGRRYHIWSSFTDINKIYCKVTNITDDDITNFKLKVVYSLLEFSLSV